ncbi:uncharacterized protein LOC106176622, partial [Lingula anatina]|uniref:ADP-ribosyl cyclase/cyclic ADP-ribose hydrolase n=1 Tax=Lingula anatina TaxID=7574 RepID=A0A1S3JVX5_LINAN
MADDPDTESSLRHASSIIVKTADGDREIQLLFGDITKLSVQEKVDVIMVSAFPGDYIPCQRSLIGALKRNLDISVKHLARDKEEDLRANFHCWWSKLLPSHLPYRRLLCFERTMKSTGHPAALVGDVFRCLVAVFNNKESTVIAPLLASGVQSFDPKMMLKAMLDAAVNWIKAGLPMSCLKLVVFAHRPDEINLEKHELWNVFESMKKKYETVTMMPEEPQIRYDIYLSYSIEDEDKVKQIEGVLKEEKKDIRIFSQVQALREDQVWQQEIYEVMITCVRVVTFLSPAFLASPECLEKYNLAVCCNRKTARHLLAPFYIESIPTFPTYMCLVQYMDFSLVQYMDFRTIDTKPQSVVQGCKTFVSLLSAKDITGQQNHQQAHTNYDYDVFISYSHKNTDKANFFLNTLTRLNPHLRIFYDRNELKAGTSWQQMLYHSVDGSKCVIALFSPTYLSSAVCTEEYNLALLKHMGETFDGQLIPVLIEPVGEVPKTHSSVKAIDAMGDAFQSVAVAICKSVVSWLKTEEMNDLVFNKVPVSLNVSKILETRRLHYFKERLELFNNQTKAKYNEKSEQPQSDSKENVPPKAEKTSPEDATAVGIDVALSYTESEEQYGQALKKMLHLKAPWVKVSKKSQSKAEGSASAELTAIDSAKVVVTFLSPSYLESSIQVEELQLALFRQRAAKEAHILYPIHILPLPRKPCYLHVVPCELALYDLLWRNQLEKKMKRNDYGMIDWDASVPYFGLDLQTVERYVKGKNPLKRVADEEMLALSLACNDIVDTLSQK